MIGCGAMPNTRSAAKRMRADRQRQLRNLRTTSELKTLTKQFEQSLQARQLQPAQDLLRLMTKKLDMASRKGIVHPNLAARKKARLSRRLHQLAAARPVRPDGSNGARALPGSLAGQARLQVTNGQLFEIPVLRGLADLLGAPALRRVTFHEAAGTFTVQQETLTTSDLTFYSQLATLTAIGSVGFNGALDAHVITSIDPTAFEHSPEFARAAGRFLHKAGYLIGEIKVSGTLANPKYEIMPVSLNRILKEQVFERLRDVFEGIFR